MKTRRRRIVALIKEFCVAFAKVLSRMAEMLRELLKEKEVK